MTFPKLSKQNKTILIIAAATVLIVAIIAAAATGQLGTLFTLILGAK